MSFVLLKINEPCYTLNLDGTIEKWYCEKILENEVFVRKSKKPKWIDTTKIFPLNKVFGNRKEAKRN
jgi:hypothetical protein